MGSPVTDSRYELYCFFSDEQHFTVICIKCSASNKTQQGPIRFIYVTSVLAFWILLTRPKYYWREYESMRTSIQTFVRKSCQSAVNILTMSPVDCMQTNVLVKN